ncbi:MAG: PD-(D/E)XK nuclease family protein [Opitutaceae bacterium]|jgi:ATP-dependent helicase/nuclease subunit B
MPSPRLHVLPWNQPLVHAVTDWLARGWSGDRPLDLADALVVVPTGQAGRRLREALAARAAQQGQAVFPPRVLMPDQLTSPDAPLEGAASRAELLLAWTETLRLAELDAVREVFPLDPPERSFAWASRLAREFIRLQATLAENSLRMADVVSRAGEDFPEAGRWRQLGALEAACDAALAAHGLRDPQAVKIVFAGAPALPEGVRRIVVAGTPDPLPLALRVLEAHAAAGVPVEVLVSGPAEDALFDEWGRPVAAAWAPRVFSPADFEQRVRLCADPAAQADAIVACALGYAQPGGRFGVGVADAEVLPSLENGLARAGVPAFNPEGRPLRGETLHTLLTALAELAGREPTFASVAALMRCPDVLAWLGGSPTHLLAALDDLHEEHLPPTLAAARAQVRDPALAKAVETVVRLRALLLVGGFPDNVRTVLTEIFKERRFDQARPEDARAIETAQAWATVLTELEAAVRRFPGLAASDVWELALRALGDSPRFDEKREGSVELQGWLELLWDDVPHLVVSGMNDGRVPDAVVGDAFLPEGLRERLGLKTNAARFARDAYLLHALEAFRADGRGRLDLLVGKTSAAGDPLRPSRLLLQCADADLPSRVAFLFGHAEAARPSPAWRRAWKLKPRADAKIERLSVTAFRDYLKCPFRFYLKHGLRMQAVDPHKAELDAMDFGTLCHDALEAMGQPDSPVRNCTDATVLRGFLLDELERTARARYGEHPVLPLVVQLESARQRLSQVAEIQAQLRAEGWVIERTEWKFEIDLGGLPVRGKIDRIDRNELTGEVRVIDYKTSDKPVNPADAHVRGPKRVEDVEALPEFARFLSGGEEAIWTDLQLPLYLEAVTAEFGHAVACGYFNLPKAAGETGVLVWGGYDADVQAAAMRCARGVAAAVQARRFWPPAELPASANDDFAGLFHEGAEASVEWMQEGGA